MRVILGHHGNSISPLQALSYFGHRRPEISLIGLLEQVRDDLGVRLRIELMPATPELAAQLGVVLDDAIVDHRELTPTTHMRMGVLISGRAMRRPTGVPDAQMSRAQTILMYMPFEDGEPPSILFEVQLSVFMEDQPRRIITPVF